MQWSRWSNQWYCLQAIALWFSLNFLVIFPQVYILLFFTHHFIVFFAPHQIVSAKICSSFFQCSPPSQVLWTGVCWNLMKRGPNYLRHFLCWPGILLPNYMEAWLNCGAGDRRGMLLQMKKERSCWRANSRPNLLAAAPLHYAKVVKAGFEVVNFDKLIFNEN